ncbi:unnamed protein product [Paramecium sonneborni]|uniref:Uncharacterized protein n=1 Tax=Paramecium sonneborni TaxID=65129 RepID=A0A8S1QZC1_9CILI|nr:unnamed protein product [Paramecium sonneborni]
MNKQVLSFITKNQSKFSYIHLLDNILNIQPINNQQFLLLQNNKLNLLSLPAQLQEIIDFNSEIQFLDCIIQETHILYFLQSLQNYNILFLIYNTNEQKLKVFERESKESLSKIKIFQIIDSEQLIYSGIMIKNEQVCLLNQGLMNLTMDICSEIQNPIDIYRINDSQYLLLSKNTLYQINKQMEIQQINLPIQMNSIPQLLSIQNQHYILQNRILIQFNEISYTQYENSIDGITLYDNNLYVYFYNDQHQLCVSNFEGKIVLKLDFHKKVCQLNIVNLNTLLIIDEQGSGYIVFQPDYKQILEQYFKLDDISNDEQQQMKQQIQQQQQKQYQVQQFKQQFTQEYLFNLNKTLRYRQNIDDMISFSLKYSYIQLLLLMCARIRVFREFFIHIQKMSENGNEQELRKLLEMQKIKKCECIENEQIMEELIEECLKYKDKRIFIYFQKFFIENPQFVNDHYYCEILQCEINRELYQKAQLEMPIIPNFAFKRVTNYILFLQKAKTVFIQDLFIKKEKQLQLVKKGMIGNAMQCYECLKPISFSVQKKRQQPQENKIVKYMDCYHAIHKQCVKMQHDCNYENNKKLFQF